MYIDLYGFFLFLVFSMIMFVGVLTIIFLVNLNKAVKNVTKIIDSNAENVNNTLAMLPKVVENVNDTAIETRTGLHKISNMFEINVKARGESDSIDSDAGGVFNFIIMVSEAIKNVLAFIHTLTDKK